MSLSSTPNVPLLEDYVDGGERDDEKLVGWWKRALDVEEAKQQVLFSLPMILTNVFYYAIMLVSVMLAGHLGELQLAGATLANSWATVTGFTLMTGLSEALETLCGQGFGAKLYKILGIHLQASCVISFSFSILISILWFFTEPLLLLFHQDTEISNTAAIYVKFLIPGIFAYGFLENILRFLQTQTIIVPLVTFSLVPLVIHVGITYVLVHYTPLDFVGAPLAASISLWLSLFILALYVAYSNRCKQTWGGFSFDSFRYIHANLRLALPSAAMVCLEYWAFEILVFVAGSMENSKTTTSLMAMCVNTESIAYMIIYGLSAAASTRVSNELGAGHTDRARNAMSVTLKLSILLALIFVLALAFGHNIWASFFGGSSTIIQEFGSMTPLLAISITIDSIQGVLSGIARGCGWQHLAMCVNLVTYYCVGMPIGVLLGFKMKLYVKGLWIGLICGMFLQAATLLLITLCTRWTKIDFSVSDHKKTQNT